MAANATHVFFSKQPGTLLARSDEGETTVVPAAPSGFGKGPVFTDRSYLSLDASRTSIATVDLAGDLVFRIARLAPGRQVVEMMAAPQETVILLTSSTSSTPGDLELLRYRAGAEAPELLLDGAALGAATSFQVAGDAVIWIERRTGGDAIEELDLTTREVSERFPAPGQVSFLQTSGDSLFLFPSIVGAPPYFLQRYSLATGQLVVTYSYAYPPVNSVAVSGLQVFGAAPRRVANGTGCHESTPLYSLESSGDSGTLRPLQHIQANGKLLFHGPNLFFSRETGGCGSLERRSIGCIRVGL